MFDPTSSKMDRLPAVLQREIWEYVRGDRTFWRRQFKQCVDDIAQPHNIRHTFKRIPPPEIPKKIPGMCACCPDPSMFPPKDPKKIAGFLSGLDLESHELNPFDGDFQLLVQFCPPLNKRVVRFISDDEFVDGVLNAHRRGDLIDGIIFTHHVPDEVRLNFSSNNTGPIRLRPVGNRLKLPWLPSVATHLTTIQLFVDGPIHTFPCQVTHCHLDNPERDFVADNPMDVSFRVGLQWYTIELENGAAFITHGKSTTKRKLMPPVAWNPPAAPQSIPLSPPQPSSLFGAVRDFFGRLW
jgi:hypothetical protein